MDAFKSKVSVDKIRSDSLCPRPVCTNQFTGRGRKVGESIAAARSSVNRVHQL